MMRIEHLAIWTDDLERLKDFYIKYFNAKSNKKYYNEETNFKSFFLSFNEGSRLEIMQKPELECDNCERTLKGLAHFAIAVGSKAKVLSLTEQLKSDGYKILSEPKMTGDGYFESLVSDPDGNKIEITI